MPSKAIEFPKLMSALSAFLDETCAIEFGTDGQDSVGQPVTVWAVVTGHEAIPCRVSALQSQGEAAGGEMVTVTRGYQLMLQGTYPVIREHMRAVVDGTAYDIQSVQFDSAGLATWLTTEVVTTP